MREIKFRCWVTLPNKAPHMEYPMEEATTPCIALELNGSVLQLDEDFMSNEAKPAQVYLPEHVTLMQFVGLKDKNGVDIYEDDFCCQRFDDKYSEGVVTISPTQGVLVGNTPIWPHDVEIIGNAYQNPNLLESKLERTV